MDLGTIVIQEEIGRGKSSIVFKGIDAQGNPIAVKINSSENTLAKIVNYPALGTPNPYRWNKDAVACAYYRRQILADLIESWFGSRLNVANARSFGWNEEYKAYALCTEFIDGAHAALRHPFSAPRDWEYNDLRFNIIPELLKRLIEAGFDGLSWQAGKGNSTAASNFKLVKNQNGTYSWVWLDLESGVPPLAPSNPLDLPFYLWQSIKRKRVLFDDVDIEKLRDYVAKHRVSLEVKIGATRYKALQDNITFLEFYQQNWKSMPRAHRSITYKLKKEYITLQQAKWYYRHPKLWYGREIGRLPFKVYEKLVADLPILVFNQATYVLLDWKRIVSHAWRYIKSPRLLAKDYASWRISEGERRKQLTIEPANILREQLRDERYSSFFNDFGVHLIVSPASKLMHFVFPVLYSTGTDLPIIGTIDLPKLIWLEAFWVVWGGPIARTSWTLPKFLYSKLANGMKTMHNFRDATVEVYNTTLSKGFIAGALRAGKKVMQTDYLIALLVGAIPKAGYAAYPLQVIVSSSIDDKALARYLRDDIFAGIGRVPIYGGRDTLTEHYTNRIPYYLGGFLIKKVPDFVTKTIPESYNRLNTWLKSIDG